MFEFEDFFVFVFDVHVGVIFIDLVVFVFDYYCLSVSSGFGFGGMEFW